MSRVFIDGFESGSVKQWDVAGTHAYVAAAGAIPGMHGDYCLDFSALNSSTQFVHKYLPENSEYYFAFKYRPTGSSGFNVLGFYYGATLLGRLRRTYDNSPFEAIRGSITELRSGLTPLIDDNTYLIEVRYKPHVSSGVFKVKINGITEFEFIGNTSDGGSLIDGVRIGYANAFIPYTRAYFDCFVVDNSAWIGDTRVQATKVAGVGNSAQWTPSVGNNYQCVDEVPPSEDDWVKTNTVGHLDSYATQALVGVIGTVKCVQVQALMMKEGSPTPLNVQLVLRSGGTNYFSGNNEIPSTTSKGFSKLWATDPATGIPWTESGVNAKEIGVKAVA